MIILKNLIIDHFICVDHAEFDFTNNYITVFYGPNGAGKSTVFEAIALCWTERRRGDSYKDFIKHGSKSATVSLTAEIHGEPIQFDIELLDKRGATPFQRVITYKKQKYTNSECTTLLESFDIDYLQHIMFSMQGENNITDLRPAERTKLLKRIFSVDFNSQLLEIDALLEQENQNLLILKTKYETLEHSKFDYEEEAATLPSTEIAEINARISAITEQIRVADQRALLQEETAKRLATIKSSQESSLARQRSVSEDIAAKTASLTRLQADKSRHSSAISALKDPDTVLKDIEEKTQTITTLQTLVNQTTTLLTEKLEMLRAWNSTSIELTSHIAAHRQGKCPQCGQLTYPESVPELESNLAAISTQIAAAELQKVQLEATIRDADRTIMQLQIDIPNLRESISQTKLLKTQYQSILKTTEDNITQTQSTLDSHRRTLKEVETQLQDYAAQIAEISPQLVRTIDVGALKVEKANLAQKLQDDATVHTQNGVVRRKNLEVKEREEANKKALSELNKQQNNIVASISNYRDAKHIIEVDLPNYIIVKACSKLEKHINKFISSIKPGMIVRLFQARSGVEFYYSPTGVINSEDDWTSTKMASGFERELLSAAWRVALARAYNLATVMLDEIDSAAATGSSEVMFREIANLTGFEQLFIVSHKPEIVDILLQESNRVVAYLTQNGTFIRQEY